MHVPLPRVKIDDLDFNPWLPWPRRRQSPGAQSPGLYLLAHFDSPPTNRVDPIAQQVIYVGQTASNSLQHRWTRFEKSATTGEFAHSGGRNYHQLFKQSDLARLHVSPLPVSVVVGPQLKAYLLFVERALIWAYIIKWGKLPSCNKE